VDKKYKVHITASAQTDIQLIYDYIAHENPVNAIHFIDELEAKVAALDHFPQRQPAIPENSFFGTDYRHLIVKKYRIIYRIVGKDVFILRIIHGMRIIEKV
jgi:toxin ParE1/3/4